MRKKVPYLLHVGHQQIRSTPESLVLVYLRLETMPIFSLNFLTVAMSHSIPFFINAVKRLKSLRIIDNIIHSKTIGLAEFAHALL